MLCPHRPASVQPDAFSSAPRSMEEEKAAVAASHQLGSFEGAVSRGAPPYRIPPVVVPSRTARAVLRAQCAYQALGTAPRRMFARGSAAVALGEGSVTPKSVRPAAPCPLSAAGTVW